MPEDGLFWNRNRLQFPELHRGFPAIVQVTSGPKKHLSGGGWSYENTVACLRRFCGVVP